MSSANQNVVRLKDVRAGDIADQVAKTVSSMADQLVDRVQSLGSRAKVVARNTDGFVRTSPWQAVGIIALVGLAAGVLVSYSARSRRAPHESDDTYDETSGG
jgi:ElaB/YqjD/DUF883 family membrane-anchored ribosome-binding protein